MDFDDFLDLISVMSDHVRKGSKNTDLPFSNRGAGFYLDV